jgi:signal transduction histidine kinase
VSGEDFWALDSGSDVASGPIIASIERHRAEVAEQLLQALQRGGSPLVRDPAMRSQLSEQVDRILDETVTSLRDGLDAVPTELDAASVEIGNQRARHGIRPVESLRAASRLYETALRTMAPDLAGTARPVASVVRLSVALERSISSRVAMVASAYFTTLLDQIHESHAEVGRRLARELHDNVAHGMTIALRDVELYESYRVADRERAHAKLSAAKSSLQDSIDTVRALATQLRRSETGEGLQAALIGYLASAASSVATTVTVTGNESSVPLAVRDELFLVLREALSNALHHADPRTITVEVRISRPQVHAVVSDDGHGFDVEKVESAATGTGLPSMMERTRRVGGTLEVESRPGRGTTVRCQIPLQRRRT